MALRRLSHGIGLAAVLMLLVVAVAAAAASGPADVDIFTNLNSPDTAYGQTEPLNLWASLSGSPDGTCTSTRITYLKWNLGDIAPGTTIQTAVMSLTRSGATSNPNNFQVSLYESDDSWDDASTYNTAPAPGSLLETQPFPAANGNQVVFNSSELLTYLQAQADGDNVASFAVQLSSSASCPTGVVSLVFDSTEDTAGVAPDLQLEDPNAITLSTFADSTSNTGTFILIAGAALALAAGVFLLFNRRRSIQS